MDQRTLIKIITIVQNLFLGISVILLATLPPLLAYNSDRLSPDFTTKLFFLSLFSAMLVMSIRPLANLLPKMRILSSLVILRKGVGVFSAAIIVSFMLSRILTDGTDYLTSFLTLEYWSLTNYLFLARIGDITAVLLLLTSNNYSKRILGKNWKRLQKLAYAYFYSGALYEMFVFKDPFAPIALVIVTLLVAAAYIVNRKKRIQKTAQ